MDLWTAGRADRLEVGALSRDETDQLARGVLGAPVDRATLRELWRVSRGVALLAREVVLAAREAGTLTRQDGDWRHHRRLVPHERLGPLVDARLGALDEAETSVVEHLAVAGSLGLALLEQLTDLGAVERLERRRLVDSHPGGRDGARVEMSLSHPLHGEVVHARLSRVRRAEIARRLAEAVEGSGARRRGDVPRLAAWRLEVGEGGDPALFLHGAHLANAAFDYPLAEQLARAGLAAGGDSQAHRLLGAALAGQRRIVEADQALVTAGETASTDEQRSDAARLRAWVLAQGRGEHSRALGVLRDARAGVSDAACLDGLSVAEATVLAHAGDLGRCLAVADEVVARGLVDERDLVAVLATRAIARALTGLARRALEDVEQGERLLRDGGQASPLFDVLFGTARVLGLVGLGRLEEAERDARAAHEAAVEEQAAEVAGAWALGLGLVLLERGRPAQARTVLADAVRALAGRDPLDLRPPVLALAATAAAMLGDTAAARRWLAERDADGSASSQRFAGWTAHAWAWVAAVDGDLAGACDALTDESGAGRRSVPLVDLAAAVDLTRFGRPGPAAAALAELAGRIDGTYVAALAAYARALAAGDAAGLEYLARQLAGYGAELVAAEASAQAGQAYARQGRARRADQLVAAARERAAVCEGARSPALLALPAGLTAREREVALLAAREASSGDIAQRLGVSRRTVDNHLAAVYAKLAVNRRGQLPEALGLSDAPNT